MGLRKSEGIFTYLPGRRWQFCKGIKKGNMALFLSTYENKIDKKGRVSVPSLFRNAVTKEDFNGIIAYPSFVNECIEACGIKRIEQISQSIDELDPYSDERDAFATSILGDSVQLSFDGEGRVLLPKNLIDTANLSDKAVFVGKGQTFEIWQPEQYKKYIENARKLAKEQRGKLRLVGSKNDKS